MSANSVQFVDDESIGSLTHLLLPHGKLGAPTDELVELCEAYDALVLPNSIGVAAVLSWHAVCERFGRI